MRRAIVTIVSVLTLVISAADVRAAEILGTNGDDVLFGTNGPDVITSVDGFDNIFGKLGSDHLYGGDSSSFLFGSSGRDVFEAGDSQDKIYDDDGRTRRREKGDVLAGEDGDDVIFSIDSEDDKILCGSGFDIVYADRGDVLRSCEKVFRSTGPTVFGEAIVVGTNSPDALTGGAVPTSLYGKNGNDTMTAGALTTGFFGGRGADTMTGGPDSDIFVDDDGEPGDVISGGAADDFIYAADGAASTIDCGEGGEVVGDWVYHDAGVDTLVDCEVLFP